MRVVYRVVAEVDLTDFRAEYNDPELTKDDLREWLRDDIQGSIDGLPQTFPHYRSLEVR